MVKKNLMMRYPHTDPISSPITRTDAANRNFTGVITKHLTLKVAEHSDSYARFKGLSRALHDRSSGLLEAHSGVH